MCGIFGYFDRNGKSLDKEKLEKMGQKIFHRGPDDQGIFAIDGVAIGNQRLSIIDIEGGNQPFTSEDGRISLVQNGEIFNHIELADELKRNGYIFKTQSDTEVLLRLYEQEGINFVSKLNGMFSIAIYDDRLKSLFLIRDRVGVKPLFIYDNGERIIFASEIKSILEAGVPREVDEVSIHHYLSFNYVPPPYTMFKNVSHVLPGHYVHISAEGTKSTQWWDLANQRVEEHSEGEWIEQFNSILDDAVRLRLRADVPFGAFLSGGIDSSTVVGLMSKYVNEPVQTFSIGFEDPRFDESMYAQQVADKFRTKHTMRKFEANMLDLWPKTTFYCDQPHGDVSFMPTYRVSELAANHVKMVLTGDGGDELFAGYDKYKSFFSSNLLSDIETFQRLYFNSISLFTEEDKRSIYTSSFYNKLKHINSYDVVTPLFERVQHMDQINQALYLDTMLLLPGNNLVKPDRMGMAVSLEARTPFLDVRMIEMAFRMPGSLKLQNGETKYIYKKAVSPLLGDEIVYRKKQMFTVPIGEWFKKDLAEFTEQKLLSGQLIARGIIQKDSVVQLLKAHQMEIKNNTREIRALISLEFWFEQFMH